MQIQNYVYPQNKYNNYKLKSHSPSFKALKMDEDIKNKLKPAYSGVIDYIEEYRDELSNYKHWDLIITPSPEGNPIFTAKNKAYNNEYMLIPDMINGTLRVNQINGKIFMPLNMPIPIYAPPISDYQEKIISDKDHFIANSFHRIYLTFDDESTAVKKARTFIVLENQYYRAINNGYVNGSFPHDFCSYPLALLKELDKAACKNTELRANRSQIDEPVKESYIVKQGDMEVVKGTKSVNSSDKKTGFAKVIGMTDLKETLKEDIILPLQNVELYKKYGIEPINGILLYGPPGTGKTFIAEALAEESGRTFLKMDVAETESKYVGETSKNILKIFQEAEQNAPSIIFIDEIEALAPSRSALEGNNSAAVGHNQSVNTLLQCMNNCSEKGIFVVTATNEPQKVDNALKRAGRIDKNIFVSPPDFDARKEYLKTQIEQVYSDDNIDYDKLANLTEYYTIQELKQNIIRQAALKALKQNRKITENDLMEQINNHKPQLSKTLVEDYEKKGEISKSQTQKSYRKIGYI